MKRFVPLVVLLVSASALAQVDPAPVLVLDPRSWFTDVAALAAIVFAITALIKGRFDLHDFATLAVSFTSGILIAVAFSFTTLFPVTLLDAVVYGISAATLASGGREGILVVLYKTFSWLGPLLRPQPITGDEPLPESQLTKKGVHTHG